jgi:hypothetical protein
LSVSLVAAFNKHLSALTTAAPNRSGRSHHHSIGGK